MEGRDPEIEKLIENFRKNLFFTLFLGILTFIILLILKINFYIALISGLFPALLILILFGSQFQKRFKPLKVKFKKRELTKREIFLLTLFLILGLLFALFSPYLGAIFLLIGVLLVEYRVKFRFKLKKQPT